MGWKARKGLEKLILLIAMAGATGCEKDNPLPEPPKDTTSPEITIYSPEQNKTYNTKKVLFSGLAKDKSGVSKLEYSTDNGQTRKSLATSWSDSLELGNGNQKITVYASDIYDNSSTRSVDFIMNYTEPPKDTTPPEITISSPENGAVYNTDIIHFEGNVTDENFSEANYTLNGGAKISLPQSWSEDKQLENANYRYIVNAKDKAGNPSADTIDFVVNKPTWKFECNPFEQPNDTTKAPLWNLFTNSTQRSDYFYDRYLNYDMTDTIQAIPNGLVCTDYASILAINFNGYGGLPPDPRGYYINNWHNIPMYTITIGIPSSPNHQVAGVVVGDDFTNINDWRIVNGQYDYIYTLTDFANMGATELVVNFTRTTDDNIGLDEIPMFRFVPDGNGYWEDSGYRNSNINLITKRK